MILYQSIERGVLTMHGLFSAMDSVTWQIIVLRCLLQPSRRDVTLLWSAEDACKRGSQDKRLRLLVFIYTGLFSRGVFASSYSVSSLAAAGSLLFVGRCLLFVCVEMGHPGTHIVLLYADLMTSQKLLRYYHCIGSRSSGNNKGYKENSTWSNFYFWIYFSRFIHSISNKTNSSFFR